MVAFAEPVFREEDCSSFDIGLVYSTRRATRGVEQIKASSIDDGRRRRSHERAGRLDDNHGLNERFCTFEIKRERERELYSVTIGRKSNV